MTEFESDVSELNGSSGFLSYEASNSEDSVNYTAQNEKNNRRLLKREKRSSHSERVIRRDEREIKSTDDVGSLHTSTPKLSQLDLAQRAFSDETIRICNYYNSHGDFWNHFPKTDYVYSRHSKWYKTEVAPGIPRIPNMTRPTYRGRYRKSLSVNLQQSEISNQSEILENEETFIVRLRRIIRTSVTTTMRTFVKVGGSAATTVPLVASATSSIASSVASASATVVSSVFSATSAVVSSVVSATTSIVSSVASATSVASSSFSSESRSTGLTCLWPLLFILLLVPIAFVAQTNNLDLPPPYVPCFVDGVSVVDLNSVTERISSPFVSLWGGTIWFCSLLTKSLFMIPTFFIETAPVVYGFFEYDATSYSYTQARHSPAHAPSSQVTLQDQDNLKLWITEVIATKLAALKEELATQTGPKEDYLDSTTVQHLTVMLTELLATRLAEHKEEIATMTQNSVQEVEELSKMTQNSVKEVEELSKWTQNSVKELEELSKENQLKIKLLKTLFNEDRARLQEVLKKSENEVKSRVETSGVIMSREDVISIVRSLLEEYHADRTGKPDYALGSNGASIASIRCTRPFNKGSPELAVWGFFLWNHINTPDIIIKPGVMPGECWAFEGANGYVAIQLSMPIFVSGFSIEHTPRELSPFGHIKSAPRKFSVWGLTSLEDQNEEFLGRFQFEDNGKSLQTYDAIVVDKPFQLVELRIESNHGHLEYTCLYRFRVHGRPSV